MNIDKRGSTDRVKETEIAKKHTAQNTSWGPLAQLVECWTLDR